MFKGIVPPQLLGETLLASRKKMAEEMLNPLIKNLKMQM